MHNLRNEGCVIRRVPGARRVAKALAGYHILIIGSVCLCHGEHASYFLAPCEPPARPARIPLGNTLCGYRTVVSVSSALMRSAVVACAFQSSHGFIVWSYRLQFTAPDDPMNCCVSRTLPITMFNAEWRCCCCCCSNHAPRRHTAQELAAFSPG